MTSPLSVTDVPVLNRWSGAAARAAPSVAVAGLALAEGWRARGSIAGADWYGYALLAVLVAAAVAAAAAYRPSRWVTTAAAALVALGAWDAVSLTWSARPELARDEALLAVVYAVAVLVPALTLRGGRDAVTATCAIVAGVGGLAVAALVEAANAGSVASVYFSRRLDFPVSYPNAEAAFALVALWPGLGLAARRGSALLVRALALGAACAAASVWVTTQSKGGALGIAVSTVVVFAVSGARLRLGIPFAITVVLTAAAFAPLTAPYRDRSIGAIHHAAVAGLLVSAAGIAAGLVYAWADARITVGPRATRAAGHVTLAALVAVAVAGAAIFYVRVDDPGDFFAAQWRSFKHLPTKDTASTHLVSLGSNRYDFWRVAVHEFEAHPVAGIGARGFREAYLLHRRSGETPARAHSVELDALSETGLIGFLLLAAALVSCVIALARRARLELVAVGALGAFACWLAQASVDWTWSFPAIGVPLFALVGIAAAGAAPRLSTRTSLPLAALAAALALGGFGLPWLAAHYVRHALAHPTSASTDLRRARALDPLSLEPDLAQWALAPNAHAGIAPLVDAVRKDPRSPDFLYALGRQQLAAGSRVAAERTLRRAERLAPGDPTVLALLRRAATH